MTATAFTDSPTLTGQATRPDPTTLAQVLSALGVEHLHQPVPYSATLLSWLDQDDLGPAARKALLSGIDGLLRPWRDTHGYQAQDLVVLHPGTAGLPDLLAQFAQPHVHRDDEVRYVLDGEGVFGFFDADGTEHRLTVGPGDFIRIPGGVEHRFGLTAHRRIKAVRLFTDAGGWSAIYTQRSVAPLPH